MVTNIYRLFHLQFVTVLVVDLEPFAALNSVVLQFHNLANHRSIISYLLNWFNWEHSYKILIDTVD